MKVDSSSTPPRRRWWLAAGTLCLFVGGSFATAPAEAQDNGPTQTGQICMQHIFGTPVQNSNRLNCTANDIRLSEAIAVSPDSCIEGSTFDLEGTFAVDVTANIRYDAAFFFRTDGGPNARGDGADASGICSLSALDPAIPPAENLDGDSCGDLQAGSYEVTFTIPDVLCVGTPDPDNPGQMILRLPNCTSWHSNQGTACNIVDPFDFDPDTKSKCVCDDDFTVPVIVETATIDVTKTASPTTVPEPGGEVTYTVDVVNEAMFVSVTLDSVIDDPYGDVADPNNPAINMTDCDGLLGLSLGPQDTVSCTFKADVEGDSGDVIEDIVTVSGTQDNTGETVFDNDNADVTITDVQSDPMLTKTSMAAGCTIDARYQVVVSNNSAFDFLTVNTLTDDPFGDITTVQGDVLETDCQPPGPIAPGGNFTCEFVGRIVSPTCNVNHVDTVTGELTDDDGVAYTRQDTATVEVSASVDTTTP